MPVLKPLALLAAFVLASGCSTSRVNDGAQSPSVVIDDAGTVLIGHRVVKVDDLASDLRSAGYRKSNEVVIQIPDSPDRLVMRQVSAELAKGGFTRTVFVKKRKASASVTNRK